MDFRETTRFDISYWGLTEKALVLTVELTGAFVADFKSDTGRIDSLNQHSLACGYQSKLHSLPLVAIVGKDLLEGIPSELSRRLVRLKEEKGEARRIQPNATMTKEQERKSTAIRRFPLSPGVLPIWEPT